MKKFKLGFENTLDFVKLKRNIVDPNEGFVRQLEEFEKNDFMFSNEGGIISLNGANNQNNMSRN